MRTRSLLFSSLLLMLALAVASAQNAPSTGAAIEEGLAVPATQAARGLPLVLGTEVRESRLAGGISFTGMYTDNVFLSANGQQSDVSYEIEPYLAWQQFTSRLSLDLSGGAGLVANQHISERNQASENLGVDVGYRLKPHLRLRVDDSFVNTTGLFSGLNSSQQSGIGVVQQQNSSLITPASHVLTNSTLTELTYQFAPHSETGVRGVVSILRYPDGATSISNIPLFEGQSYSVETFYNRQFSARQWFGVTVRAQRFESQSSQVRTDAGSALLFYSLVPTSALSISLHAGPQVTNTHVSPPLAATLGPFDHHNLTPTAGATLSWQKSRTTAHLSYIRQASDGGGLFSAVTNETVQAGIRQALTDRQQVTFTFTYGGNETLAPGVTLRGYSSQAEYTRRLAAGLNGGGGYRFDRQGVDGTNTPAHANRFWISLSYEFSKPLGR
jgi:hypothetical protein